MTTVRKSLADIQRAPYRLTAEQKRKILLTSETDIGGDVNPPAIEADLKKGETARVLRQLRAKFSLTQEQFSARFSIPIATLRDWEQGRREPDAPAKALIRIIEHEPEAAARALGAA